MTTTDQYTVRHASEEDAAKIASLEALCFPSAEAASPETILMRLKTYPECFTVVEDGGEIICVVDGPVTQSGDLTDEMYSDVSLHDIQGPWQMIFGVETHPSYRKRGIAGLALRSFLSDARGMGLSGAVLTCKEELIHYYSGFGFVNEGVSVSVHGGAKWYQMRLRF